MTDQLQLNNTHKVLEIGTGSGYQTAFLAKFSHKVFTVELHTLLQAQARVRLEAIACHTIHYKLGDESLGWAEHTPYDRIMVTAALKTIPLELLEQLAPEAIMIIPVSPPGWQELVTLTAGHAGQSSCSHARIHRIMDSWPVIGASRC